jgi:hypothetical protein
MSYQELGMNSSALLARFKLLSEHSKTLFVCRLVHAMTVYARSTYVAGTEGVMDPQLLRWLNEVQHRLIGQAVNLISQDVQRYSDASFCDLLCAISEDARYGHKFSKVLRRTLDEAVQADAHDGGK